MYCTEATWCPSSWGEPCACAEIQEATRQRVASAIEKAEADGWNAAIEAAAKVIGHAASEHRIENPQHREPGRWCDHFGCTDLDRFADAIRALARPGAK